MLTRILLVISMFMISSSAMGGVWLNAHIGSRHLNMDEYTITSETRKIIKGEKRLVSTITFYSFNEVNPGLGLEYELNDNLSFRVGTYKNSLNINSEYAGIKYSYNHNKYVSYGLIGGLVTGYELTGNAHYRKYVLPNITVKFNKSTRLEVGYVPPNLSDVSIISVTVGYRF